MEAIESTGFLNLPKASIITSVALHFMILVALAGGPYLGALGIHIFPESKKPLNMYQSFVQVDVVALPDQVINSPNDALLTLAENPKVEAPIKEKEVTKEIMEDKTSKQMELKKEAEMAEKKNSLKRKAEEKKAMKEALEEMKREQALKGLQAKSGKAGRGKIKGNLLSQGTAMTGAIGTASDKYNGVLTETIKQHFNLYSWQQKKGLVAIVVMMLSPNGRVKYRKIVKGSNDPMYDSAVLQAIDEAQPFPVPEDKSLLSDEITINFKP